MLLVKQMASLVFCNGFKFNRKLFAIVHKLFGVHVGCCRLYEVQFIRQSVQSNGNYLKSGLP